MAFCLFNEFGERHVPLQLSHQVVIPFCVISVVADIVSHPFETIRYREVYVQSTLTSEQTHSEYVIPASQGSSQLSPKKFPRVRTKHEGTFLELFPQVRDPKHAPPGVD